MSGANGAPLSKQTSYSASKSAMAAIFGKDHKYSKEAEQKSQSQVEPPSGIKGKGTVDEPFDQGNAPENIAGNKSAAAAGKEPVSGVQGKGTKDEPYDQGNAGEITAGNQPVNTSATPTAASDPREPSPSSKPTTNGNTSNDDSRGRTLAPPSNNSRYERSVSPGTLDDGTHELCGGETGGSYEPKRGVGRLANKMFGSNK